MNPDSGSTASNAPGDGSPAPATFRLPLGPRLLTLLAVVVCGGAGVLVGPVAVLALVSRQWALGALILAVAWLMASLTAYAARDIRGKWGLRVVLDADVLGLDPPAGWSLIHNAPARHARIPYADIEAVETRLEAHRTLEMAMLQRAYVQRRRRGEALYLFEDRAVGTSFRTSFFPDLVLPGPRGRHRRARRRPCPRPRHDRGRRRPRPSAASGASGVTWRSPGRCRSSSSSSPCC